MITTPDVPFPSGDDARVAALQSYGILDTPPEAAYDAFATLAAAICETPIAFVSLVDETRNWLKASFGLEGVREMPREVSFCAHAVASGTMLEVNDALLDARFRDLPGVTGDPNLRFYAGAPLIDRDGQALGTICAIDRRPRELTAEQRESLTSLAKVVVTFIESRKGVEPRTLDQLALVSGALESAPDPIVIVRVSEPGQLGVIVFANRAFIDLFGYGLGELLGHTFELLHGPNADRSRIARLKAAAASGEPGSEIVVLTTAGGVERTVEIRGRHIAAEYRIVALRDLTRLHLTQAALTNANQRLASLLSNNNDAVFTIDRLGNCLDTNVAAEKLFGYSRGEFQGFGFLAAMGKTLFPGDEAFPVKLLSGKPFEYVTTFAHREGHALEVDCKVVPMIVAGVVEGAYVIAKDITERRRLTDLVTEQAKRTHALYLISAARASAEAEQIDAALRLAADSFSMEAGYVGEVRGGKLTVTNRFGESPITIGYTIELDRSFAGIAVAQRDVITVADIGDSDRGPNVARKYPGWHGYIASPLVVDGTVTGVIGILARRRVAFSDFDRQFMRLVSALISTLLERQSQQKQLDRMAFYDQLTGLPNRAKFMATLGDALEDGRAGEHVFALHCIDLDGFKAVNDAAGHAVGDLALQEVGRRLRDLVRPCDLPARLGGDEFVLLQGEIAGRSDTMALGSRIVEKLSEPYVLEGATYALGASVGVALFPEDGRDAKTLLHNADLALYAAKNQGKGRVEFIGGIPASR
jgi:diguanylate cyclase (GGDEF)-like protein/PAS domain S-box-containing protein